ncbi:hypothetical protein A2701_04525 [Candidatus Amesbacteria bacterium RIFCSPHIGHO2_01_FULL_47_34]|uniref:5'-deoxynucleotidase n=2 Tax=Candidatus Amesiibacteriota TaxID=1752730 RepID=A0A0G1UE88_9BACT|nr:MAG: HD domain protein [Candidatus Amesbacteria bacterium GW2011_GWC1_47_15]OGC99740.1 MAG: hypothetical protein A2972_01915 [Candidatus Amesbacteria bacterium RIFCSPLOWO2_01_FULL_47_33]OGD00597.1 MAG: hypothetical protein A2701_04525 [Candidatus Amesbacteria bacterium RIFCSPHIGHO2_01_FULL_47_34]
MKKVLYLIQQSGMLFNIRRSLKQLGSSYDNVASHSHQTAVIAYCLCRMESFSDADAQKAVTMAVFHDLAEARSGDANFIEKHYVTQDDTRAVKDQFSGLDFGSDLGKLIEEYEARVTPVSRCVKDADSLQQIYTEWVLYWQGNKLAKMWFDSDFNDRVPGMFTASAKKLALSLKDSHPNEWWWSQFMDNDAAKDLNKLLGQKTKNSV